MYHLKDYTKMFQEMFPGAIIESSAEMGLFGVTYGFSVTIDLRNANIKTRSMNLKLLNEVQKKMNATSFFIYPSEPIIPGTARLYFHICVDIKNET